MTKNQTGPVSFVQTDPRDKFRTLYSFNFQNLEIENNKLGIFKTALHQRVKINNLNFKYYDYGNSEKLNDNFLKLFGTKNSNEKTVYKTIEKLASIKTYVDNFDSSNLSEIKIDGIDFQFIHQDGSFFNLISKTAHASINQPQILFSGHVLIKTPDGGTLEANRAKFNLKNKLFKIEGVYVLEKNGIKKSGKGICVDANLNIINSQNNNLEDGQKCLANL